jgi:hypothetical protein
MPIEMETRKLRSLCCEGLTEAFRKFCPEAKLDEIEYTVRLEDNLLPGVDLNEITSEFEVGAGQELRRKMRAPYSSSALVVNTFGRWKRDPETLVLGGRTNFTRLCFERQCHSGLGGTPPHLDLIAECDDQVIAVESKCTEYLSPKKADFSESYERIQDHRCKTEWYKHLLELKDNPHFYRWLDGAQLIKHYLGIAKTYVKPAVLIYLYWQPTNWTQYAAFGDHRKELKSFEERVKGDGGVRFASQSYDELWQSWLEVFKSTSVLDHIAQCLRRYSLALPVQMSTPGAEKCS